MADCWESLRGPFPAVSKPIFVSKYALEKEIEKRVDMDEKFTKDSFESSWRDLQDSHTFAPLESNSLHRSEFKIQLNFVTHFRMFAVLFSKLNWLFAIVIQILPMLMTFSETSAMCVQKIKIS